MLPFNSHTKQDLQDGWHRWKGCEDLLLSTDHQFRHHKTKVSHLTHKSCITFQWTLTVFFFSLMWSRKNIAEMVIGLNWRTHLIFFIFARGQKCLELLILQKGEPCYLCWFPTRQVRLLAWLSFRLFLYHCLLHFIISRYVKQTKPCRFYCALYLSSKQSCRFI